MLQVIPELIEVAGRKRIKITLRDGETILDADVIDPLNATSRRKVASRLAERSGEPHAAERIEQALLQCIDTMNDAAGSANEEHPAEERITAATLVRPEIILAEGVVALSVPEVIIRNKEAIGRWRLYLRFADGRRESRPLPQRLPMADQQSLWIHPQPPAPAPPVICAWSDEGRTKWLEAKDDPTPADVFKRICVAFDDFLDLPEEDCGVLKVDCRSDPASDAVSTINNQQSTLNTPSPTAALLALWTILTYAYVAWDAVPYLYVGGPAGSGKTRVFELLSRLVFRGFNSSNLSAPALFRTLHDRGGTLLLDEAERLNEGAPDAAELRSILLAGYKRGGRASRLESASDGNFQMTEFAVFGPKAIACIAGVEGPLATRCIPIHMFRSAPDSLKPKRRIDADPSRWQALRDDLHALTLGQLGACALTLANQDDVCPLSGRQYELWQPILALATFVDADGGMNLVARLQDYAKKLIDANREQLIPEADLIVLRVLTGKLMKDEEPTCEQLLQTAKRVHEPLFRQMSATGIGRLLRKYRFITRKNADHRRVITLDQVPNIDQVERNYGIDLKSSRLPEMAIIKWRRY